MVEQTVLTSCSAAVEIPCKTLNLHHLRGQRVQGQQRLMSCIANSCEQAQSFATFVLLS